MLRQSVALCVCLYVCVSVTGAPHRTSYDQRQQGELNIHAQLDNIVVVFIPTSNINMMELGLKNKYHQEKPQGFLQFLQKFKDDMATVNNEISSGVASSQEMIVNQNFGQSNEEKEEEVVATIEEMKPDSTEKIVADMPKEETTKGTPINEHSTLSETVQDSVLVISVPEELKDDVKVAEDEVKFTLPIKKSDNTFDSDLKSEPTEVVPVKEESNVDKIIKDLPKKELTQEDLLRPDAGKETVESATPSEDKVKKSSEAIPYLPENEMIVTAVLHEASKKPQDIVLESNEQISEEPKKKIEEPLKNFNTEEEPKKKIDEPLKKVSTEEEPKKIADAPKTSESEPKRSVEDLPKKVVEVPRREKVIKYKAETKWAPGLVDMMGPVGQKSRVEVQRFASLCHPGVWDPELKTCLMPGDRRSRSDLTKFLEAIRFGIAAPAPAN